MSYEPKKPEVDLVRSAWQELYIEMEADPTDHRSVTEFAKDCGINASIVYTWRKKNKLEIAREVDRRRKEFVSHMRSLAWKCLENKMSKDTKAIQLCFQLLGDLIERSESKVDYMSPEDKRERIRQLLEDAKAKVKARETTEDASNDSKSSGRE